MTPEEQMELSRIADKLEEETYYSTGISRISGGFARTDIARVSDDDAKEWRITLTWGVQSDVENTVHTEHYIYTLGGGYNSLHQEP